MYSPEVSPISKPMRTPRAWYKMYVRTELTGHKKPGCITYHTTQYGYYIIPVVVFRTENTKLLLLYKVTKTEDITTCPSKRHTGSVAPTAAGVLLLLSSSKSCVRRWVGDGTGAINFNSLLFFILQCLIRFGTAAAAVPRTDRVTIHI